MSRRIELSASCRNADDEHRDDPATFEFKVDESQTVPEVDYDLGEDPTRWDEFSPTVYRLTTSLDATAGDERFEHSVTTDFGLHDFETEGTQFTVNGRTTFLRRNIDCCIFPETGYPPRRQAFFISSILG